MSPPRNAKPRVGTGLGTNGDTDSPDTSPDPRVVQGIRTKRHSDQRPPQWEPPAGWHAANLLD
jgi:hypothetical protein